LILNFFVPDIDVQQAFRDAQNRLIQINVVNPQQANQVDNVLMGYDGYGRRVSITERHGTTVLNAKTFVWCEAQLCQERDITGHTVNKQFFDTGERIGTTNYYYTKDHLGSVREMTDAAGTVHARYDYDSWGRQTKLSGDLDSDFGYAGYYNYKTTNQYLTWCRVYDPNMGRWLSRDPLKEKEGLNLYEYVKNDSFKWKDPFGLCQHSSHGGAPMVPSGWSADDVENAESISFAKDGAELVAAVVITGIVGAVWGVVLAIPTAIVFAVIFPEPFGYEPSSWARLPQDDGEDSCKLYGPAF
jgi:RHS repeat-associated protein